VKELYEQEEEGEPQPILSPPPVIEHPPSKPELVTIELEIHKLVNTERNKAGLQELQYDDTLAEIAETHSIDMSPAGRHFYDSVKRVNPLYRDYPYPNHHTNPDGLNSVNRARKAGYTGWTYYGENLLYYQNTNLNKMPKQEIAQKIMYGTKGWWKSPSHRKNILSPNFNREGLGIYVYGDTVWATQNFSRKR
jgi:uncharacterized protein YkwD